MDTHEVITNKERGKWILTKIKDNKWQGWWFRYLCSECGWTTNTKPANLKCCPNCNRPMEDIVNGNNQ